MRTTFTLAASLLALAASIPQAVAADLAPKDRTVIVISLDGFPAFALENPRLPVPTLRKLMRDGASARRMQPVNPTVTWPNHTAMVTGVQPAEHGVIFNGTLVRSSAPAPGKVDPTPSKERMVTGATVYDLAYQAGLTTAQVDWVAINDARTITWAFPEKAKTSDPLVREMIENHAIDADDIGSTGNPSIVWRDQTWTKAATYLIRRHKPNLLLFHLLTLDSTHHNFGPGTLATDIGVAFLDTCVAQLVAAVEEAGLTARTTFVIVSDHGFKPVTRQIEVATLLRQAGITNGVSVLSEGGSAMIYVEGHDAGLIARVQRAVQGAEGIASVASKPDFPALGLPDPAQNPQMADVVLYAKTNFGFGARPDAETPVTVNGRTTGTHGYAATDPDMDAIFIASGYGIRKGVVLDRIQNLRVAPTLATLLGLKLPNAKAAPLDEILIPASR